MKTLGALVIALAVTAGPAAAEQGKSGMKQQSSQQDTMSKPLGQAKIEGKVQEVSKDQLTLSVAGTELTLTADQQQLQNVQQGDNVQVTAVPLPMAQEITAMQQASQQQRQQAQTQQDPKVVTGSIQDIQENVVTIQSQTMGSTRVKVDKKEAQSLQKGGQYIFELSSAPDEAKEWKALKVQKI